MLEAVAHAQFHSPHAQSIYVMLNHMVFFIPEAERDAEKPWKPILTRHLSYFGDSHGIDGLLKLIGEDDPWFKRIKEIMEDYEKGAFHRKPFELWQADGLEDDFRDIIPKMTDLDPARRITAQEALAHRFFKNIMLDEPDAKGV